MLFDSYFHRVLWIGLAIALTSCQNSVTEPSTKAIEISPPNPEQIATPLPVFTDAPTVSNPPVSTIPQNSPRPRPRKTPVALKSGEIPVIIEGGSVPINDPIVIPKSPPNNRRNRTIENEVKNALSNEFGIDITSLKCPELNAVKVGKAVTCTSKTDGGNFTVKLTNRGERFEYEPQGIISISELENNIESAINSRQGQTIKANCAGEILLFEAGDYLNCRIVDAEGKDRSVSISFKDRTGNSQGLNVSILGGNSPRPAINKTPNPTVKPQKVTPSIATNSTVENQNSQRLEKSLKKLLSKRTGIAIAAVNCPDKIEKNFSKVYNCQATTRQGKFSLAVTLTNPQGGFKYQAKGLLLPAKLSEVISKEVENSTGKKVEVDCGETPIIFQPGETLGCQISTGRGEPQNIKVKIQDDQGKKVRVTYDLAG